MNFLKNYTSAVPVSQTIARIEALLIKCGMTAITKEYSPTGDVAALRFRFRVSDLPEMDVRLPVLTEQAIEALWRDYAGKDRISSNGQEVLSGYKHKRRMDFVEQGKRTAWRIAQEWLEIELSRMLLKQGDPREVFMAYLWDGQQTLFQRIEANGFRALLPETTTHEHND